MHRIILHSNISKRKKSSEKKENRIEERSKSDDREKDRSRKIKKGNRGSKREAELWCERGHGRGH